MAHGDGDRGSNGKGSLVDECIALFVVGLLLALQLLELFLLAPPLRTESIDESIKMEKLRSLWFTKEK